MECCSYNCNDKNPGQHKPWPKPKILTPEEIKLEKCCVKDCGGPADFRNLGVWRYEEKEHVWIETYKCAACWEKAQKKSENNEGRNPDKA